MSATPSLSLALRWLISDQGLSEQELAVLAGVSPGAVTAFLTRPHAPSVTWLQLLQTLRCRLVVRTPNRIIPIALPNGHARRRAHERAQWESRRLIAFRSQLLRQSPGMSTAQAQQTARSYVESSAARLDRELKAARERLETVHLERNAPGLRVIVRLVADAARVNAEDLSLLAGVSLRAAQVALTADDGQLATPHRLFSAIAARLSVEPGGGGAITVALAPPGAWRPEAPRPGRTSLSHDEINARALRGESLASIAREAGVSRQRVHAIVRTSNSR